MKLMNIWRAMRFMSVPKSSGLFYIDVTYTVASCLLGQVYTSVTHNSDRDLKFLSLRHPAFPRVFERLWGGWSYTFFSNRPLELTLLSQTVIGVGSSLRNAMKDLKRKKLSHILLKISCSSDLTLKQFASNLPLCVPRIMHSEMTNRFSCLKQMQAVIIQITVTLCFTSQTSKMNLNG